MKKLVWILFTFIFPLGIVYAAPTSNQGKPCGGYSIKITTEHHSDSLFQMAKEKLEPFTDLGHYGSTHT